MDNSNKSPIINSRQWAPPDVPADIPHGDMPGDQVKIGKEHIEKANTIFPMLLSELETVFTENICNRAVITVCGGSGVGKSEIASLISYYLQQIGIGSYTLSGDNYPHRIPQYNDAERMRVFRAGGIRGLISNGQYTKERADILKQLQCDDRDADTALTKEHPWLNFYQQEGRKALKGYLGTANEQDFGQLTEIVSQFKNQADTIWLKRMGRTETELWYDKVDFSNVNVLVIEWTHGNSDYYQGVDIPVLLNSTPKETAEHRRQRNRDGKVDSAFTTMVLEIEQKLLEAQAYKAKLIVAKNGELLNYADYRALMTQ